MSKLFNITVNTIVTCLVMISIVTLKLNAEPVGESHSGTKPTATTKPSVTKSKIAIVIDDLGDNLAAGKKIMQLPGRLTLAIMPLTPHAKKIALLASQKKHDVIMHQPMDSLTKTNLLGKGAILANMSRGQLEKTFVKNAKSIPNLVGFNNHMGSLLTQDNKRMDWLMQMAFAEGWYFVDSKTSSQSVAKTIAIEVGLPAIARDIFLDHHDDDTELPSILTAQFNSAKNIALKRGYVVIICHPYPETLKFLSENLSGLSSEFELVSVSQLIKK